jgi:hypothetical protein
MTETDLKFVQEVFSFFEKLMVGVAAIVGSILTQREIQKWSTAREKEKLLQEKTEKLVMEILALEVWIGYARERALTNGRFESENHDPIGHIATLFELYFPSLEKEYHSLMRSMDTILSSLRNREATVDKQMWDRLFDGYLKTSRQCVRAIRQAKKEYRP